MMVSCELCKKKIITESDPHAVIPTPRGYFDNCGCYFKTAEEASLIEIGKLALGRIGQVNKGYHCDDNMAFTKAINRHNKEFKK